MRTSGSVAISALVTLAALTGVASAAAAGTPEPQLLKAYQPVLVFHPQELFPPTRASARRARSDPPAREEERPPLWALREMDAVAASLETLAGVELDDGDAPARGRGRGQADEAMPVPKEEVTMPHRFWLNQAV